jgi:hypothetical protein
LAKEVWSKYLNPADQAGPEERKQAAIKKWQLAELRNQATNVRLYSQECHFSIKGKMVSSLSILEFARNTIGRVLGQIDPKVEVYPDLEALYGTFTSGASTMFPRGPGVLEKKFMDEAHVTSAALPWFWTVYQGCDGWLSYARDGAPRGALVQVARGNMLFTVDKTAEIDRVACKEPGLNMFLQKGVGDYLRRRLRSELGLDLNDQTPNQRLAQQGSATGKLATLDLSSASDLISHQLVFSLLPLGWFHLLNDIRSRETKVEDDWVELNMFSSMGNAFTFELETLIFWSLVNSCTYHAGVSGTIAVYGDDIVCPSEVAGLVAQVFAWLGFKVNTKKSFWRGPFRESCGKHYYAGVDVTPFYVKEPIASIPRLIHFLNKFRLWSSDGLCLDEECFPLWDKYRQLVPREWRGGRDHGEIGQLVTDESPMKRLVAVKSRYQVDVTGSYLHWLRAADGRPNRSWVRCDLRQSGLVVDIEEPLVTSRVEVDTRDYREVSISNADKHQPTIQPGYIPGWP